MNIMVITAMFPPIRTGSSHYAHDLAAHLLKRGNDVSVVALKNRTDANDTYNFPVYRLSTIHLENLFRKYFKHFRVSSFFADNYITLNRLVRENKIQGMFLVSHYHDIALIAAATAFRNKIPLICSVNTQLQSINPRVDKIFNFFDKLICGKFVFPFCRKIVSLDSKICAYLKDVHGKSACDKSVLIPYGVYGDPDIFLNRSNDGRFHNQLLGVGSVIEQRNFLFSVLVFNELLKTFPNLKFKIIGHIYYDAAVRLVEKLGIKDKVIFVGELPHDDVLEEVKKSDIFMGILSGKYTGLGTATLEAMLMGVPVVSNVPSDLFGERKLEDMRHYVYADVSYAAQNTGHISASAELVDDIAEKISSVLKDVNMRERIGQGGREFISKNLTWERISEDVENLFSSLINQKKK